MLFVSTYTDNFEAELIEIGAYFAIWQKTSNVVIEHDTELTSTSLTACIRHHASRCARRQIRHMYGLQSDTKVTNEDDESKLQEVI